MPHSNYFSSSSGTRCRRKNTAAIKRRKRRTKCVACIKIEKDATHTKKKTRTRTTLQESHTLHLNCCVCELQLCRCAKEANKPLNPIDKSHYTRHSLPLSLSTSSLCLSQPALLPFAELSKIDDASAVHRQRRLRQRS